MNFLTNINLNGNELQNVVIQNVATDPSNPKKGQLWFNTTEGVFKYLKDVNDIKVVGNGNGTLTEADITELREAVNNLDSVVNSEENGLPAITSKVDEAKTIAESASEVAGQAKSSADSAVAEAQTATSTANSATTAANEAKGTASEAATTANEAKEIANRAESTANDAATAASTAQETADDAAAAAATAQTTADSKVEKVVGGVDNIVLFAADGALKDSGIKIADIEAGGSGEVDTSGLISKVSGAVEGNLPSLAADGSLVDSGYSVISNINESEDNKLPTSSAIISYIERQISNIAQGLIFKGVVNSELDIPTTFNAGFMYYVQTAGTYFGNICSVGDILVSIINRENSGNQNSDWIVLEGNKDIFSGATSELDGTSGLVPAPVKGDNTKYLRGDGVWSAPVAERYIVYNNGIDESYENNTVTWIINHNLGRMDVHANVYKKNGSYYEQVMCEIRLSSSGNRCTVSFNSETQPVANDYFVVIM